MQLIFDLPDAAKNWRGQCLTQALFIGRCEKPIFLANKRFLSLPKQEPVP